MSGLRIDPQEPIFWLGSFDEGFPTMRNHSLARTLVYKFVLFLCAIFIANLSTRAADITSTLIGSGTWTNNGIWDSTLFPNNGNGGFTYDAIINAGSVDIPALTEIVIESLSFGFGQISGGGGLQLNASSSWTGNGEFVGPAAGMGQLTLSGSGPLTVSNACCFKLFRGSVTNAGTLVWQEGAPIASNTTGSTFTNVGLIDHQGDGTSFGVLSSPGTLINAPDGILRRSVGLGIATITMPLTNNGTIDVDTGILEINGGGSSSGTIDVAMGAEVTFNSNNSFTFQNGASSTGAGLVRVSGGTVDLNGTTSFTNLRVSGGTLNVNGNTQVANLQIDSETAGGTVSGSGTITLTGPSSWRNGTLIGPTPGMGQLTLGGVGTLNVNSNCCFKQFSGAVTNAGTIVVQPGAERIRGNSGSIFTNTGLIDIRSDGLAIDPSAPGASTLINPAGGIVRRSVGTGIATASLPVTNYGTIEARTGTLNLTGGLSNIDVPAASLSGGTYRAIGSGVLQISASAISTIAAGTTVEFSGANPVIQFGITSLKDSLLNNGGTLRIRDGHAFTLAQPLNNTGTIELGAAGLAAASLNSTGGITTAPGGAIVGHGQINGLLTNNGSLAGNSPTEFLEINGTVRGSGFMKDVRIDDTHIVGLTDTTAVVSLEGSYMLNGDGSRLEIELDGLAPGTKHDQLVSTGTITLDGILDVSFIDSDFSYNSASGDRFTIFTATSPLLGAFDAINLPNAGGGAHLTWLPPDFSNPNEIVLEIATAVPYDADYDLDGDVDGRDFLLWQRGASPSSLSKRDLAMWQQEYGTSGGPLSTADAVPEPGGILLVLIVALMCVAKERHQLARRLP